MRIAILTTDSRQHYRDFGNPVPSFGTAPEALLQGFAKLKDVEVHVVCCAQAPMKSPEKLVPNIYYHGLVVPSIGWMKTAYQGCIRAVRRKLRKIQPDIVHGQGTERDCAISAVCSGFPNVLTIHGNMRLIAEVNHVKPFSYFWLAAKLERITIPRSDGVVCITHYTQQAIGNWAKKTWILPNAVDASFFDIDARPPAGKVPRILCVGVVSPRKNQNAFIRALDSLAPQGKFEVVFLGLTEKGNPYDEEFLRLVQERPWCVYSGLANRERTKEYFREAAAVALPSLEDNCPMVVLEGMAAGVPVVAANVGGVPDLVEDGKTGFYCNPLDAQSMAGAIEKVFQDRSRAEEMVRCAKKEALERFHPEVIARRHVSIYEEVLRAKKS